MKKQQQAFLDFTRNRSNGLSYNRSSAMVEPSKNKFIVS